MNPSTKERFQLLAQSVQAEMKKRDDVWQQRKNAEEAKRQQFAESQRRNQETISKFFPETALPPLKAAAASLSFNDCRCEVTKPDVLTPRIAEVRLEIMKTGFSNAALLKIEIAEDCSTVKFDGRCEPNSDSEDDYVVEEFLGNDQGDDTQPKRPPERRVDKTFFTETVEFKKISSETIANVFETFVQKFLAKT